MLHTYVIMTKADHREDVFLRECSKEEGEWAVAESVNWPGCEWTVVYECGPEPLDVKTLAYYVRNEAKEAA